MALVRAHPHKSGLRTPSTTARIRRQAPKPDPQSQSLSQSYRSIMPTTLIHIGASARGFKPRRPDAVMSTARREGVAPPGFQGGPVTHRTLLNRQRSADARALAPNDSIPGGSRRQEEKTTLPKATVPVPGLVRVAVYPPVRSRGS